MWDFSLIIFFHVNPYETLYTFSLLHRYQSYKKTSPSNIPVFFHFRPLMLQNISTDITKNENSAHFKLTKGSSQRERTWLGIFFFFVIHSKSGFISSSFWCLGVLNVVCRHIPNGARSLFTADDCTNFSMEPPSVVSHIQHFRFLLYDSASCGFSLNVNMLTMFLLYNLFLYKNSYTLVYWISILIRILLI